MREKELAKIFLFTCWAKINRNHVFADAVKLSDKLTEEREGGSTDKI